jgi:predicted transcriptional regulator
MSVEWFKWAKTVKGLKSSEKFVLICLVDYFNDNLGYAYPAQKTIADYTCLERSTINRACKSLQKRGFISWKHQHKDSGRYSSNKYVLHRVADSHTSENNTSMLQSATNPCGTVQQKYLSKNLNLTINSSNKNKSIKVKRLSDKQVSYAEKMANEYWKLFRHEQYVFDSLLADCRAYLLSSQTDDDWNAIGNGLPPPSEIL